MPTIVYTENNDVVSHNSASSDTLIFIGGDDRLTMFAGTVQAFMGEGDDLVDLRGGTSTVYGESGEDRFEIYVGATLYGGGDNDLFNIRGGNGLTIDGGAGADRFNFAAAATALVLQGGAGNDDFAGFDLASTGEIRGGSGNDLFTGFRSGVTIYGEGGDDTYRVNPGSSATFVELADDGDDSVHLMRGADYVMPDNIENVVISTLPGSDSTSAIVTGNAIANDMRGHGNVETFNGLGGNDRIFAKGGDDTLNGGEGHDLLDGGGDNDTINGGAGNDRLVGRTGDDTMTGGTGNDTYYVDSVGDSVNENPDEGTDTVRTTISYQLGANVEIGSLEGTADLLLYGNELGNTLYGNSGNNIVYGWGGDDVVRGGAGNDTLSGLDGVDTVYGEAGDDAIYAYSGVDTMSGGAGADTYFFVDHSYSTPAEVDEIVEFDVTADVIDFSGIDANVNVADDQAFTFSFSGPAANAMWQTAVADGPGNWFVTTYADVDGDAVADVQVDWYQTGGSAVIGGDIIM